MRSGSNPKLDIVLVNLLSQTDHPSWERALQYRDLHSAAGTERDHGKIRKSFSFGVDSFRKYGSGVFLYFSLLQMLTLTFLILSLNSLPIILSNAKGNGLDMYG